jgi:hypothetical protein
MAEQFIIDKLKADVAEKVDAANAGLLARVVDRVAASKIAEREQMLFDSLAKYEEVKGEFVKLSKKSDNDTVVQEGDKFVTKPGWKPETIKKIEAAKKKLADFKQAYLWAIEGRPQFKDANGNKKFVDKHEEGKTTLVPDYEPLKKALKGGGGGDNKPAASDEAAQETTE